MAERTIITDDEYVFTKFMARKRAELLEQKHNLPKTVSAARLPGQPRRAKILTDEQLEYVLRYVATTHAGASAELKILLSHYAGLRVSEIVSLTLDRVTDAEGRIADSIWIPASRSKSTRDREIPMHPKIKASLARFRRRHPDLDYFAFSARYGKPKRQSVNACAKWFAVLYKKLGFAGCSSHSGRRSFITDTARVAGSVGASLRDVQVLAGHSRLDTTEAYIEPSEDLVSLVRLVRSARARRSTSPRA